MAQYSEAFAEALQFVWGEGFLSPGGPEEVALMLRGLDPRGCRVLDIGSGAGGIDVLLVERHGVREVVGLDVEPLLIEKAAALAARKGLADRLTFRLVEPGPLPVADGSFDLVFSKDSIVHIPDKAALYRDVLRILRPGGWFAASDWLFADGAATSPAIVNWLSGGPLTFAFVTPGEADAALRQAGFTEVAVVERNAWLKEANRAEEECLSGPARELLAERVGAEIAAQRLHSAKGRQAALESGDLRPCHLRARKPL